MRENGKVAVVGLGYVGLPLALLVAGKGFDVVGFDLDQTKIDSILRGASPFVDDEVDLQLKSSAISVTSDVADIAGSDTIIVCVPTPVDENYQPNLDPVIGACKGIAPYITPDTLLIIESTINPGVCDELLIPILEEETGYVCGVDFYLAHCPERINPGDPTWNVRNIARVVGGNDPISLERAHEFYSLVVSAPIKKMGSLKEAEAVKVVENSFRDINIAFVNELAMSFDVLGIDVVNVIDGAATKPFAFMPHYPGAGVGGHCIPVDPYYLIEYARKNGFEHKFLSSARTINNGMPVFVVDSLQALLAQQGKEIAGAKIMVLGLSYKANVGDLRESPSLKIISELQSRGVNVAAQDPYIRTPKGVGESFVEASEFAFFETADRLDRANIISAMRGADAVIIATAHDEYAALEPTDFNQADVSLVVDGRNCLDKQAFTDAGIIYRGVGR